MSQQKVDKYKEEKANRQQIMRKQKTARTLRTLALVAIVVALVAWFSVSVVRSRLAQREPVATQINSTAIESYLNEITDMIDAE